MQNHLLLIVVCFFIGQPGSAQVGLTDPYAKAWHQSDSLNHQGLPLSAKAKVLEILQRARTERNPWQQLKAIRQLVDLSAETEEEESSGRHYLQKWISASGEYFPMLSDNDENLRHSLISIAASWLGQWYENFQNSRRYEIAGRTPVKDAAGPDISSWSVEVFRDTARYWFQKSVEHPDKLHIPVDSMPELLTEFSEAGALVAPSLLDLLLKRTLDFYDRQRDEFSCTSQPPLSNVDKWYLRGELFTRIPQVQLGAETCMSDALRCYQVGIQQATTHQNQEAQAYWDLGRIQYVYQHVQGIQRDRLYINALDTLLESSSRTAYSTTIAHTIAQFYYQALEKNKNAELIDAAVAKFPTSSGARLCKALLHQLHQSHCRIQAEAVIPSKRPLQIMATLKNVGEANCIIYKINSQEFLSIQKSIEAGEVWNADILRKPLLIRTVQLNHWEVGIDTNVIISFPSLKTGHYVAVMDVGEGKVSNPPAAIFQVSDLVWTSYAKYQNTVVRFVDRTNGRPQASVKADILVSEYSADERRFFRRKLFQKISDRQGRLSLQLSGHAWYSLTAMKGRDTLILNDVLALPVAQWNFSHKSVHLLTDRSIYRPGQTIYFKGIILRKDQNGVPSILPNAMVKIRWTDPNGQTISEEERVSNEFGSFHGSVLVPTGRLTGSYSLVVTSGDDLYETKMIQVEEYRRPVFFVESKPVKEVILPGSNVNVEFSASLYAGSALKSASCRYVIKRKSRNLWFMGRGRVYPPDQGEQVLASGVLEIDGGGRVVVPFQTPDVVDAGSDGDAVQFYEVAVTVTDSRGESHEASNVISVSHRPFFWDGKSIQDHDVSDTSSLKFIARNWQGEQVFPNATLTVFRLADPQRVTQVSSPFIGSQFAANESIRFLPDGQDIAMFESLKIVEKVYSAQYSAGTPFSQVRNLNPGIYQFELSAEVNGRAQVAHKMYFVVTDWQKKVFPKVKYLYSRFSNNTAQPGEVVSLELVAPEQVVWAHVVVFQGQRFLSDSMVKVKSHLTINIPITADEIGGIGVYISYMRNNRWVHLTDKIEVPWEDKYLKIEVEGLRDAALPGSQQKVNILVRSKHGMPKTDFLASMYDSSLDYFVSNSWNTVLYPDLSGRFELVRPGVGQLVSDGALWPPFADTTVYEDMTFPELRGFERLYPQVMYMERSVQSPMEDAGIQPQSAGKGAREEAIENLPTEDQEMSAKNAVSVRKNLKETVFFYPWIYTDSTGKCQVSFSMNEALSRWKLMIFGHTRDFAQVYLEKMIETRLPVMVFPYMPRYFREGDQLKISGRIENQTDSLFQGTAQFRFFDALSGKDITAQISPARNMEAIRLAPGADTTILWEVLVPRGEFQAITWKFSAGNGALTDAEQNTIPVYSSRVLLTDAQTISVGAGETTEISFNALPGPLSASADDMRYVFEMVGHPVWYVVQALPQVTFQQDISSIGLAEKLFVQQLARQIVSTNPRIRDVFGLWQSDPEALKSPLMKQEDLKSVMLQETPWLAEAMDESAARLGIARLFDANQMDMEKESLLSQILARQLPNGAISWLPSSAPDAFTTLYVLEKIGHLQHLGALTVDDPAWALLSERAIGYLDKMLIDRHQQILDMIRRYGGNAEANHLDAQVIHMLYVRSFFTHVSMKQEARLASEYFLRQVNQYWTSVRIYDQAMAGFVLYRQQQKTWQLIVQSLRERARQNKQLGMYWSTASREAWNDWPLERHSLIMLLFAETGLRENELRQLQQWLLRHKQGSAWQYPRATILAVYAMLMSSDLNDPVNLLSDTTPFEVQLFGLPEGVLSRPAEAGTGYLKWSWSGKEIDPTKAKLIVKNPGKSLIWGGLYHQYLEEESKAIPDKGVELQLEGQWYQKTTSQIGVTLVPVHSPTVVQKGAILVLRLQIKADRHLEYLHLKTPNPAATEALQVRSGYGYTSGLSFYTSVRDASASYFIPSVEKGTYILEHEVRVTHAGMFQSGTATIECLYAPEFRARTSSTGLSIH